jgi:hypothetical protein
MSATNRPTTRRSPVPAPKGLLAAPVAGVSVTSPARVEALRKLVAAGQYQVSPRWIATRIFRMAGVKVPE